MGKHELYFKMLNGDSIRFGMKIGKYVPLKGQILELYAHTPPTLSLHCTK